MALMCSVMAWATDITTADGLKSFLEADETASATVTEDVDISGLGVIYVSGDKTLTVNNDVTVFYKRQGSLANIVVPEGAQLTMLGSGTFRPTATEAAWDQSDGCRLVDNNGTLVIGVLNDANNCLKLYSTTLRRGSIVSTNANATTTINNVEIFAAMAATWNSGGTQIINGGRFLSISHTGNGYNNDWYSYLLRNDEAAYTRINGGFFQGVHGAFDSADDAKVDIHGGTFRTVYGINIKNYTGENPWAEVGTLKKNYYAFYVATGSEVNVYGGEFYVQLPSAGANRTALLGNDDAYNYYGVANLYGGKWSAKVNVQDKKNAESTFPASVPSTSAWYSAFGTEAPLPAGYAYQDITSGADYDAGYRYEVICTNPNQEAVTEDVDLAEQTIAEDAVVTVGKDVNVTVGDGTTEEEVAVEQIFVNQGATVTVKEGSTLTVGDGGLNVGYGGSVTVEPGATLKIGEAGAVTASSEALVIESNDDVQGVLLYDPAVSENTQPKATVKLTTKARQIGASSYVFERFAIPTINGGATTYSIEGGIPTSGLYNDAPAFLQAVWEWNNTTDEWEQLSQFKDMQAFRGYQLTNNSANGGLVYVFEGNLIGNQNQNFEFVENGFHFFGNSYSADINIKSFLNSLGDNVEKTIWVYDPYDKTFKTITERMANGRVKYGNGEQIKDVRSMQAFLMYLSDGESGTAGVNYASAIWDNPKYNPAAAPAPARREASNEDWVTIRVSAANGLKDEVILNQSEDFTAAFENGADANKFMNNENINLYAATNAGNLAVVATNDLNNTILTFAAGNATEYTLQFADIEGYEFTLRDNVTGANVLMTEGATYTFEQEANTTVPARFEILGAAKMPTAIDNVEAAAKANGIYTVTGQFLGHDFTNLPAGVYVVNGVKIVK